MKCFYLLVLLPLLASCASTAPEVPEASASYSSAVHVVQDGYGRAARFILCAESDCPRPTGKTPGRLTEAPAPATPMPSNRLESPLSPVVPSVKEMVQPSSPLETTAKHYVVRFASGSARLTPAAKALLDGVTKEMVNADHVVIRGRTDSTGGQQLNDQLAERRAQNVRRYLLNKSKAIDRLLRIEAEGRCCYVASNNSANDRQLNRRTELDIFIVPAPAKNEK